MQIITDGRFHVDKSVVALGMFDGVHIGHRVLLQRGAALAHQRGVPLIVCTFQSHPLQVIAPQKCPPMLCTFEERNTLMEEMGVDVLYAIPFTREVMQMPPEDYVGHLVRSFHPTDVVCGYNHTFGREGKGTPALLTALGAALGFGTSIVPHITLQGQDVSSTVIRGALQKGQVQTAWHMLDRPYRLTAKVEERQNGLCTLSLPNEGKLLLPGGLYRAVCSDGHHRYPVQIRLLGDEALFALPAHCPLNECIQLEWLCSLSLDF